MEIKWLGTITVKSKCHARHYYQQQLVSDGAFTAQTIILLNEFTSGLVALHDTKLLNEQNITALMSNASKYSMGDGFLGLGRVLFVGSNIHAIRTH